MTISRIDIWKYSIPMSPFEIATGTMHFAQNIFIRIDVSDGIYGVGECSAFPMITGETQNTCFAIACDLAALWKNKDASAIDERLDELNAIAYNYTIKSAFDMALYDLSAKASNQPLYNYLGGFQKTIETDLTIGIDTPDNMSQKAADYVTKGVRIIKIKLGKSVNDDIERVKRIRSAVGEKIIFRIDANQGWTFDDAVFALNKLAEFNIEFCEQPMRSCDDPYLPRLKSTSPIPIMADESVFNHYDAIRLIKEKACDFINIKFAKSGGIREAKLIHDVCLENGIPCMMGGMLESRVALTAFAHFAMAHSNFKFYDMDTCLIGHLADPVTGGVKYNGFFLEVPSEAGIGANVDDAFLKNCTKISI
jgi:o-succinylbenzoate synthase